MKKTPYRKPKRLTAAELVKKPLAVQLDLEQRGCLKKRAYATKKEAETVRNQVHVRKNGRRNAHNVCVYECVFCGQWHIGRREKDKGLRDSERVSIYPPMRRREQMDKQRSPWDDPGTPVAFELPKVETTWNVIATDAKDNHLPSETPDERITRLSRKIQKLEHDVTFWQGKFHMVKSENNELRKKAVLAEKLRSAIADAVEKL